MFQISNQWMLFLLDVSTKALLLALIAGISLKLLKLRDSNVRHRVWSGVLAGMLSLPLLALVLPTIPLSIPAGWTNIETTVEQAPLEPTHVTINETNTIPPYEKSPLENREVPASLPESIPPSTSQDEEIASTTVIVSNGETSRILLAVPDALLIFWIAVSFIFALRLVTGLWSSSQLLRRGEMVDGPRIQDCLAELPTALSRRLPTIRESSEVLVPVTVGWLRPTVLLPEEWQTWTHKKLSAIVAHEFTHVARRDFFVTLAAELNRCLYWFHPVSWWLRSRLSDLAEEACDDAAIGHTGDRTGYARHLLEVATSLTTRSGQRVQPGVSMARESNVESRITTILDFKRPLSKHLTWRSATAITLVAIPVIVAAAAIRPASSAIATSNEEPMATASDADDDATTTDRETVHIRGQVTDTNAKPIPNARVRLYRMRFSEWNVGSKTSTLLTELEVDSEGRFDQSVAKDKVIQAAKNSVSRAALPKSHVWWTLLVVSAPNYAYSTFGAEQSGRIIMGKKFISPGFLKQSLMVILRPAVTLRGRLLSIEGQPVEGASVSVFQVRRPHASRFDAWLQQTSKVPLAKSNNRAMMMGAPVSRDVFFPIPDAEFQLPQQSVQPVVTNSAGIFELSGLAAKDDLVVLRIKDKRITDTTIHVLARDMKTVYGYYDYSKTGAYYGRSFDFITQPSVPVYGVVRDIETKRPLAGIPVTVYTIYGKTVTQKGYIATKTDEKGRYRIEGLPIPPAGSRRNKGNSIAVRPGKLPYIEHDSFPVLRGDGVKPIELNIELRRAVMAKGRLTNKATGAPIAFAEIYYAPYSKNENCEKYHRYADRSVRLLGNSDTRYHSDEDGYFSIPVIPGRGVIGATIKAGGYVTGFGAEKIEAFQGKALSGSGRVLSDHFVPSLFQSLKEIDVPNDKSEFTLSMHVDAGQSMTMNFVDPGGDPVKGLLANGLSGNMGGKMIKDDHAQATGLTVGVMRPMYFSNNTEKLMRFMRLIPEKGQTHFTVKLFPPSRLKGRLVDPEGRPLANVALETRHENDPFMSGSLPQVQTDKEGRFDYPLPIGTSYEILIKIKKYFIVMQKLENPEPKNIDLGDLILDLEADEWSKVKAKREPVITDLVSDIAEDATSESNTQD